MSYLHISIDVLPYSRWRSKAKKQHLHWITIETVRHRSLPIGEKVNLLNQMVVDAFYQWPLILLYSRSTGVRPVLNLLWRGSTYCADESKSSLTISFASTFMLKKPARHRNFISRSHCKQCGFLQFGTARKEHVRCSICSRCTMVVMQRRISLYCSALAETNRATSLRLPVETKACRCEHICMINWAMYIDDHKRKN